MSRACTSITKQIIQAFSYLEQSLYIYMQSGNQWGQGQVFINMAVGRWKQQQLVQASDLMRQSLACFRSIGDQDGLAECLEVAGMMAAPSDSITATRVLGAADEIRRSTQTTVLSMLQTEL